MFTITKLLILILFIIASIVLINYTYYEKNNNTFEQFEDRTNQDTDYKLSFNDFLTKYNIKGKDELKNILSGNYNEDLNYIYNNNLTLYYSIFSKDSLNLTTYLWKNISPYFTKNVLKECKTRNHMEYTDFVLEKKGDIIADKIDGLVIKETFLQGPLTHQLGINSINFTYVLLFKIGILEKHDDNLSFFKSYANTISNNALSIEIIGNSIRFDYKDTYTVKFRIDYAGISEPFISPDIELNRNNVLLLNCVKDKYSIDVSIFDMSTMIKIPIVTINEIKEIDSNIILSNKEISINQNSNLNIHIYAIALFNQSITDNMYIINYFNNELYKISAEFKTLSSVYLSVEDHDQNKSSSCIYDKIVCDTCDDIIDWNNITSLTNASKECKTAINDFCKLNTTAKGCECWQSNSLECQIIKSMFDGTSNLTLCTQSNVNSNIDNFDCSIYKDCLKKFNVPFGRIDDFYIKKYESITPKTVSNNS